MKEAIFHLSFTIAAFIFNLALCVLVTVNGTDDRHKNKTFRNFTYVLLIGNALTCFDELFRRSAVIHVPYTVRLVVYVLALLSNATLTYYFAKYAEGYFEDRPRKNPISFFNKLLMIGCVGIAVVCFFIVYPNIGESRLSYVLPKVPKYILAYYSELYFVVYAAVVIISRRNGLNKRARFTAATAFAVLISGIVFEMYNKTGIMFNYFGAILGLYIFYIGVETPDYKNLMHTMKELEEARERADEANNFKSEFLANMSHEIRTPINAVIGMNEMIIRECDDPSIIEYSKDIDSAGKNLLSIINGVLDLSKIEAGKMEIIEEPYPVAKLINDVTLMISFKAKEKGLYFKVEEAPDMPPALYGDETRVRQIIVNVLNNAVKYTEKGGVTLKLDHEGSGEDFALVVYISDTGIGIREEDIPRLFEKFDRMEIDRNRTVEGTGLGLSIVKRLIEIMHGTVKVKSIYGESTTFTIRIPQRVVDKTDAEYINDRNEAARKERAVHEAMLHAPNAHILVVDDNKTNLTVAKALLKRTLVRVDTAGSGAVAIEMAGAAKYDLILLDNRMPGMSGDEALPLIREAKSGLNRETPVICLTADAVVGAKERYLSEGFDDYLAKPIESFALESMLIKYLPKELVEVL